MSTSVIIVGVEEVVKAVDTVVGDVVVILSVGVIEVGKTMVGKDGAVVFGEIVSALFCCETSTF